MASQDKELTTVIKYIEYLFGYIGNETDWFKLKVELVNLCPPKIKKLFSRRHYSTKKHIVSDFDRKVIEYIQITTGRVLFIDQTRMHDPNWVHQPKGWALQDINNKRKKEKENAANSKKAT